MNSTFPNKTSVEEAELGNIYFCLKNVSEDWADKQIQETVFRAIVSVRDNLYSSGKATECIICRLVILTSDYDSEVTCWQDMLGYPRTISSDENATAIGRYLTWGDGKPETTFSILIMSVDIGARLILKDLDIQSYNFALGILAHEFAHVHDSLRLLQTFRNFQHPLGHDWIGIKQSIAQSIWSEYFAEKIASDYLDSLQFEIQSDLAVQLIKASIYKLQNAIVKYRVTGDMFSLWSLATSEVSKTLNQIGRAIGLAVGLSGKDNIAGLYKKVEAVSLDWKQIIEKFIMSLQKMESTDSWTLDTFSELSKDVEATFNILGIFPKISDNNFRIDIPYSKSNPNG